MEKVKVKASVLFPVLLSSLCLIGMACALLGVYEKNGIMIRHYGSMMQAYYIAESGLVWAIQRQNSEGQKGRWESFFEGRVDFQDGDYAVVRKVYSRKGQVVDGYIHVYGFHKRSNMGRNIRVYMEGHVLESMETTSISYEATDFRAY